MNRQLNKLALTALLPMIIFCGSIEMSAQSRPLAVKPKAARKRLPRTSHPPAAAVPANPILSPQPAPVSIVNLAEPGYLSGEASVTVNPKQPTVIRLGLAQNAVSIVEFPAADGIYYIHEGNPKLASVFQSPTKETDRSITVYPGESFLPSRDGNTAAAISLQMRSGLVLILEFVPVSDLRKNAHRCVVTYDRDAVIAARRTAGLAYNLGGETGPVSPVDSRVTSKLVGLASSTETASVPDTPSDSDHPIRTAYADVSWAGKAGERKRSVRKRNESEISAIANKKLAESLRDPKKHFASWSKPHAGLELAISRTTEIDAETRLVIVAIRNVTASNLRLVPGSPELQIQTSDSTDRPLQTERVQSLYIESTAAENLVMPGSTAYYALVYRAPILGANQTVRVLVAHREAADTPVVAPIGSLKAKE